MEKYKEQCWRTCHDVGKLKTRKTFTQWKVGYNGR